MHAMHVHVHVCVCAVLTFSSCAKYARSEHELTRTVAQARDIEESGRVYLETYRTLNMMSMRTRIYI